jgi:hypothetical protein
MILEAQAFPPIHGIAPHPPHSPFSLCVPPILEPKVGGATLACGWRGGANSDVWRESMALCYSVSSKLLIRHQQTINHQWTDENDTEKSAKLVIDHVANKSVHYRNILLIATLCVGAVTLWLKIRFRKKIFHSVPVDASTTKALNNWGRVTRKRNSVFGQI